MPAWGSGRGGGRTCCFASRSIARGSWGGGGGFGLKVDVCCWWELRSREAGRHFPAKPIGTRNRRRTLVPSQKKVRAPPLHLFILEFQERQNNTMAPTKPSPKGGKGGNKGK